MVLTDKRFDFSLLENVLRLTGSILINQRLDIIYDPLLRSLASQRWFSSHQEDSTPWWSCTSPPLWSWRSVRSVCDGSCGSSPHVHHPVTEDAETRQPSLCLLSRATAAVTVNLSNMKRNIHRKSEPSSCSSLHFLFLSPSHTYFSIIFSSLLFLSTFFLPLYIPPKAPPPFHMVWRWCPLVVA